MQHLGGEEAEDPAGHARMWFRMQKHFYPFNTPEFCHGHNFFLKWALSLP